MNRGKMSKLRQIREISSAGPRYSIQARLRINELES